MIIDEGQLIIDVEKGALSQPASGAYCRIVFSV
jgi:hypothetical protein